MRNDVKIKALRKKFSHKGYAVWCYLLESIAYSENFILPYTPIDRELLVADFDLDEIEELDEIVEYCVKLNLLQLRNDTLQCDKLCERMKPLIERRGKRRVSEPDYTSCATPELDAAPAPAPKQTEALSKEEKEKIYEVFYFDKNCIEYRAEAERFINHYSANGWMRNNSSTPISNKVALAKNWKVENENKRVPDPFNKWLKSVYVKVKKTQPDVARNILRGITEIKSENIEDNLKIFVYCNDKTVVDNIESAGMPHEFDITYKIPKKAN